jgi:hypothetical protein
MRRSDLKYADSEPSLETGSKILQKRAEMGFQRFPQDSPIGKLQNPRLKTQKEARTTADQYKALRANFGGLATTLDSNRIAEAVEAFKRLDASGLQESLPSVVDQFLANHDRRNQSISREVLFEQYITTKEKAHPKYIADIWQTLDKFPALEQKMVSGERNLDDIARGTRNVSQAISGLDGRPQKD